MEENTISLAQRDGLKRIWIMLVSFALKCLGLCKVVQMQCHILTWAAQFDLFHPNFSSPESSLLHDNVASVLCLDTLANSDDLYMHVSRPPKPDTPMHSFQQQLEEVSCFTALENMEYRPILVFKTLICGHFSRWFPPDFPGWSWDWSTRRSILWSPQ